MSARMFRLRGELDPNLVKLFYDPQTAGGLLLAVAEDKASDVLGELATQLSTRRDYWTSDAVRRDSELWS